MAVVSAQDIAKPFDEDGQPYPIFGTRSPALHSFRLTYPAPNDREINLVQVLVGGNSEDLSPSADLNPSRIPDGRLEVLLQDAAPSGEEFGYYVAHSTLRIPGARRFQIRDVGCVNKCIRRLPFEAGFGEVQQSIIALVGFKLFFTGARDHELDRVGVWFRGTDLHVAFRDANGGDTFGYLVDFLVIPTIGLNVATGIERGTATALQTVPFQTPNRSHFVLTGWAFNFKRDDQEILDMGVVRGESSLTAIFRDKTGGDSFDWRVEWAHIGPQVFAPQ